MPFYIRKSISAGPFRFNLSKSGLGLSVGIRGLRIGAGPRGHYIHAGRGGLYYRASLGQAAPRPHSVVPEIRRPQSDNTQQYSESPVQMVEIESGDVLEMRDERFQELLDEINAKQSQVRYEVLFACGMLGLGLVATYLLGQAGLVVLGFSLPAWAVGKWLDSYKRRAVLFYKLDQEVAKAYEAVTHAFDGLMSCSGKWHVQASGVVRDLDTWKRNAGATTIISSKPTTLGYAVPNVIATNITPPLIQTGQQTIYFFPDVALVVQGKKIGAIGHSNLEVQSRPSPFIEERTVPTDAKVIRYTWKYTNKKGGPDRRFSGNYQIPVCLYEEAYITSKDGLNELIQFSRTGVVEPFSSALGDLARRTGQAKEPSDDKPNRSALLATDGVFAKDTAPKSDKSVARRSKEASSPMEEQIKEPLPKLLGELDDLVGADEAKEKIRRLSALAAANQARRERGIKVAAQTYHLVFAGNPGTGKTTFARLIARIFHSLGYLKRGHLVEVDRSGLVGGYLGQTALKTQEVVDKAKGGVLFIDEVYALVNHDDQYGQEAIATLVKAMEDLRDEIIVIVAGYTERMEGFLNANPAFGAAFEKPYISRI